MIIAHYAHRFPADYDIQIIRDRAGRRGHGARIQHRAPRRSSRSRASPWDGSASPRGASVVSKIARLWMTRVLGGMLGSQDGY